MSDGGWLTADDLRIVKANQQLWLDQVQDVERRLRRAVDVRRDFGNACVERLESWLADLKASKVPRHPKRIAAVFRDLRGVIDAQWATRMEAEVLPGAKAIEEALGELDATQTAIHREVTNRIKASLSVEMRQWIELRVQLQGLLEELEQRAIPPE